MMKAKRILPWALALALALSLSTPTVALAAKSKSPSKGCTVYAPQDKKDGKKGDKKSDKKKMIDFTLIPSSTKADEQSITVWCSGSEGSSFVGWRPSYQGATYTSTKNFVNITEDREFKVTSNGWYAACLIDCNGNFQYRLINVTNIITHDKDFRGVPVDPKCYDHRHGDNYRPYRKDCKW